MNTRRNSSSKKNENRASKNDKNISFNKKSLKTNEGYIRPEGFKGKELFSGERNQTNNLHKKSFVKKKTTIEKENDGSVRLNKYIANSGICSRREADTFIEQGVVKINGKVVTEMGYKVMPTDEIFFDGKYIRPEKSVYVLLNKPKGFISTTKDEKARKTVMDLVANASPYRLYPVGRLDRQTTGVLLLTNDGELTKKLTHPSHDIKKLYHVVLDKTVNVEHFDQLLKGLRFEEGIAKVDKISYIDGASKKEVGVEIHMGWNRIVRRMFERLGFTVEKLDRVVFAGLTKKNIKRGYWRILTEQEVNNLKML